MSKQVKIGLEGYAKVQLREDGKLVGDSGWMKNVITDYGLNEGLAHVILGSAGSCRVAAAALGSGTAPATNTVTLPGIIEDNTDGRDSDISNAIVSTADAAGVTCRWYGTFASSDVHFSTSHASIQNIGLYASTATNAGSLLCGATYATSALAPNQDVEYSYEWQIATTT